MKHCKICGCELTSKNRKGRYLYCKDDFKKKEKQYNQKYFNERKESNTPIIGLQRDNFVLNAY